MDMTHWLKKEKPTSDEIYNRIDSLKEKHKERGLTETQAKAKAEMELLKPKKLADLGFLNKKESFYNAITFYFKSQEEFDLVAKHFKISDYLGYNTHDTELLIKLLKMIDSGEINV